MRAGFQALSVCRGCCSVMLPTFCCGPYDGEPKVLRSFVKCAQRGGSVGSACDTEAAQRKRNAGLVV